MTVIPVSDHMNAWPRPAVSWSRQLKEHIGLTMRITAGLPGTIPRSEGGKLNRILDLRKTT
jgi:phenylacetate-coenzyme A ligase PaaK-like adenylate-forming protein